MQTLASPGAARKVRIMMRNRQASRGARRHIGAMVVASLLAVPSVIEAQVNGDGFLFSKPSGSFSIRAGYALANTNSEPFTVMQSQTTIGPRSFDAFNFGFDFNYFMTRRTDLTFTVDVSTRSNTAEYKEWEEDGRPIRHQSSLDRVALGGGFRYNLAERGRQISALAFIPAAIVPYVGATGGVLWYELVQKGDFVEITSDSTGNIHNDRLESNHYNLMGQMFAGVERRINERLSLTGETRYTHSTAKLVKDYAGLGDIQLSGLAFSLGATVRF